MNSRLFFSKAKQPPQIPAYHLSLPFFSGCHCRSSQHLLVAPAIYPAIFQRHSVWHLGGVSAVARWARCIDRYRSFRRRLHSEGVPSGRAARLVCHGRPDRPRPRPRPRPRLIYDPSALTSARSMVNRIQIVSAANKNDIRHWRLPPSCRAALQRRQKRLSHALPRALQLQKHQWHWNIIIQIGLWSERDNDNIDYWIGYHTNCYLQNSKRCIQWDPTGFHRELEIFNTLNIDVFKRPNH